MAMQPAARATRGDRDIPSKRRSDALIEEMFERQRTPVSALPDPTPLVRNLARCVVEVIAGARDAEQIARWLEPTVYTQLLTRVVVAARARQAKGARVSVPTISMGSCRIDYPTDDAIEAVAIVHTPARVRAVVMRLVGMDGRWRATELAVL
ncbi:MAG TPA: Rv3235 family protein [Microbacteriaceae bacterium]|nr:Rv3235 family protein [Microbacteriaceae bacterium]